MRIGGVNEVVEKNVHADLNLAGDSAEALGNGKGDVGKRTGGTGGTRGTEIDTSLAELAESFLEARQRISDPKPISRKTARSYRQGLACFRPALVSARLEEDITGLVATIVEDALVSGRMSDAGINVYIRALNSFLSWSKGLGFLQSQIRIKLLAVKRRKKPLTLNWKSIDEWKAFKCVTLSQLRVKHMALLILDAGGRAEECLTCLDSDVEWAGSRLWIRKGEGGANREVPLSTEGKKYLRQFLALTSRNRPQGMGSPLFLTKTGLPWSYRNSLRDLKKVATRLGTPWVSWHTFRRTFGTQYLRNGGLLTDLQEIYGHRDIRTTILYLGTGIEDIVALHDDCSPLSSSRRRRRDSASEVRLAQTALTGCSRKR
jgi:site-specific recombinase XerD